MSKKLKASGLYEYLERVKAFDSNSKEIINAAKKAYWKKYRKEWAKKKKRETRQYTVVFTIEESKTVAEAANRHKRTVPRFIKEACLANLKRPFLVPDVVAVREIKQLLTYNFLALQKLLEDDKISYSTDKIVVGKMEALEKDVMKALVTPVEDKTDER